MHKPAGSIPPPALPALRTGGRLAANRRLAGRLVLATVGALAFAFALVPFYDVLCRATGLNGKSFDGLPASAGGIDTGRVVTVEFTGMAMPGLGWEVTPDQARIRVHPGEPAVAGFRVRNPGPLPGTARAIASISPGPAARQLQKIECFCFREQALAAGEERVMPVSFVLSPDLDRDTGTLTLSYAFYGADAP